MAPATGKEDRVFVRHGRRHYRRRYSPTELRIGIGVLCLLGLLIGWIAWRGAHPDPELFASNADLLLTGGEAEVDRGALPLVLTVPGWNEGPVSHFDASNLYEKINGREGYYKRFGFERLTFVSLTLETDATVAVDIELFDLTEPANALGAYAGERPPEIEPWTDAGGMGHLDRNALLMTRGRYYLRALGSEESPAITEQLTRIRTAFEEAPALVEEDGLPPFYAVFAEMGLDPSQVSYVAENAFSFGFARDVYTALLEDGETEVFLVASEDEEGATALSGQFNEGFLGYGSPLDGSGTIQWIEDRYIGTLAGAMPQGSWVVGVRGAPNLEAAEEALASLGEAVSTLPQ